MLGIVLQLWNEVGHLFGDYWLVVEIVLYWVSSEFLTQMMSSQLVFNLLSSQECIHRLYHWEEWLPSLVWSRSGNSLHQHIKVGLPFDWWSEIWSYSKDVSSLLRWFATGIWVNLLRDRPFSFPPGKWLDSVFFQTKTFAAPVLSANTARLKFTLVPSSCSSSWQSVGVCYDKLITTWPSAPGLPVIGRQSDVVIFPM